MGGRVQMRKSMNENGNEFRNCLVLVGQKQCWVSLGHSSWLVSLKAGNQDHGGGGAGGR